MRNGTRDRRTPGSESSCVVCGTTDLRTLSFTRLQDGERVSVCGSHKTAHHRSGVIASSIDELKKLTADRRAS